MPTHHPPARLAASVRSRTIALTAGLLVLAANLPATIALASDPPDAAGGPGLRPTIQYEEAMAHANDATTFVAGDRVTVPF